MGNITDSLNPKLVDLRILKTTTTGLTLGAKANVTNPTNYTASIPYIDIHILKNGSLLGHATARNLEIATGNNSNLEVEAIYDPFTYGGDRAVSIGRELISQYISRWNTSITLQLHEDSIPHQPALGRALSRFPIEVDAPRLGTKPPGNGDGDDDDDDDDDDDAGHFIKDAVMHLFTSTATFVLMSPLQHSTLYIDRINATAFYRGDTVGVIDYDDPFGVPPVAQTPGGEGFETPRLPVDWSFGSVGYDAVKNALGGTLKLATRAEINVRLGKWRERVWFEGKGLGIRVRL